MCLLHHMVNNCNDVRNFRRTRSSSMNCESGPVVLHCSNSQPETESQKSNKNCYVIDFPLCYSGSWSFCERDMIWPMPHRRIDEVI